MRTFSEYFGMLRVVLFTFENMFSLFFFSIQSKSSIFQDINQ